MVSNDYGTGKIPVKILPISAREIAKMTHYYKLCTA